ncbi:MAG: aromatic amino acid lyase, partial [Acholeplasmataceae bacterium]|nr:aromatic amino acid lyase [Acholeplasmataceae bacterium]
MIILDGKSLTLESLKSIARDDEKVGISASSKILVDKASSFVSKVSKQDLPVYGINTGFGKLSSIIIEKNQVDQLQINLLMSHACGMGEPLPCDVVRGMMALRINALVKGYSGIRLCTIEKMVE